MSILRALAITSTFLISIITHAEEKNISMEQVLERAASGPDVKVSRAMAGEAEATSTAAWRGTYMPRLTGGFSYTHLFGDESLKVPPIGPLTLPPFGLGPDFTSASIQLSQTLFDPANMLYKAGAAEKLAEAEKLKSSREVKENQGRAMNHYLQILELRARRNALEQFVKNLKSRQTEISRLYQLGNVAESDVLKIKLGVDDANQGIRESLQKELFLGQLLADTLGETTPLSPEALADDLPDIAKIPATSEPEKREDIQGLDRQLDSLERARSGDKAEYLPKVVASVQHYYTDTDILTKKNIDAIGVQLLWSIYDGGVDLSKSQAAAEKSRALSEKRALALATIRASYQDSVARLRIKKQEYDERRSAVIEAKKVTDIEFRRLKSGKTTVNNLIDAEDVLKDRLEKASLSKTHWYQAWFNMQLASGAELRVP